MRRRLLPLIALLALAAAAHAGPVKPIPAPEFPDTWLNGGPYHAEDLEGKAVLILFFYADQPFMKAMWPALAEQAAAAKEKPLLILAANPGSSEVQLERYIRENRVQFPVVADLTRDYERRCGINPPIAMQNLLQPRLITPKGQLVPVSVGTETANNQILLKIEGTIKDALLGTSWKVDPTLTPPALKAAWWAVEWGQWPVAAPQVKRALASADPKTKEAAAKLDAVVTAAIERRAGAAKAAEAEGKKWEAYKLHSFVAARFKPYEQAKAADLAARKLSADAQVQKEIRGAAALQMAQRLLGSPNSRQQADGRAGLGAVVRTYPGTEAAERAKSLLGP